MTTQEQELRERRSAKLTDATTKLGAAKTTEERSAVDAIMAEVRQLTSDIAVLAEADKLQGEERDRAAAEEAAKRSGRPPVAQPGTNPEEKRELSKDEVEKRNREHRAAYTKWMQYGDSADLRAMSVGTPSAGGYFVPVDLADSVESAILTYGGVASSLGQLTTSTGELINYPTSNDTGNSAVIIGENPTSPASEQDILLNSIPSNVSTLTTKKVLVSNQILQDSKWDLDKFINDNLVERSARGLAGYIVGGSTDGNFAALTSVTVGYTTPAGQTTTLGLTDLTDLFGALDPAYADRGKWVMNRKTQLYLASLRNQYGTPIFTLAPDGQLKNIYGQEIVIDMQMPNIAANATPIVFGNLQKYILRRVSGFGIRRLNELYAEYNQTAFVGFFRAGSLLVDAGTHPIQSLKMAGS